ncbi:extracellular serine/threonine protein kinase four-jointed, partial [Chrysoperla carnea]|uniref:extracellular serine/threonine protein kinase four-jointed n=1 Tax=Chrysoperla carnea TaxID=189513 RepID=UPI001D08D125
MTTSPNHHFQGGIMAQENFPRRYHKLQPMKFLQTNFCYISVFIAFILGLIIGVFIPIVYFTTNSTLNNTTELKLRSTRTTLNDSDLNTQILLKNIFINNSYSNLIGVNSSEFESEISSVKFINTSESIVLGHNQNWNIIKDNIYWGEGIESALPRGFRGEANTQWKNYIQNGQGVAVRLEMGCGRMQNRLITFKDGTQACVRYRQNTDQIQGELFSFYLGQILQLPNLVPSTISIIDTQSPLWSNLGIDLISSAQWNSNRPVVLTKYINDLNSAQIPQIFKPIDRHLNVNDIKNLTNGLNFNQLSQMKRDQLIELAQWSDLIIFDYLTANLDRIVNNLYNYQWNINIMDAPAHNLAKNIHTNLLIFLDNESGLLHGYRLLKKYEIYHKILLDNLCVFRRHTVNIIRQLKFDKNIGKILNEMFNMENSFKIKDILPTLPDKSIKILNERITHVFNQIEKCKL